MALYVLVDPVRGANRRQMCFQFRQPVGRPVAHPGEYFVVVGRFGCRWLYAENADRVVGVRQVVGADPFEGGDGFARAQRPPRAGEHLPGIARTGTDVGVEPRTGPGIVLDGQGPETVLGDQRPEDPVPDAVGLPGEPGGFADSDHGGGGQAVDQFPQFRPGVGGIGAEYGLRRAAQPLVHRFGDDGRVRGGHEVLLRSRWSVANQPRTSTIVQVKLDTRIETGTLTAVCASGPRCTDCAQW